MKFFRRYSTNATGSTTDRDMDSWVRSVFRTESLAANQISDSWRTGGHNLAVLSLREVASRLNMSTEGVKQVEKRALRKLRRAFRKEIEEWFNETDKARKPDFYRPIPEPIPQYVRPEPRRMPKPKPMFELIPKPPTAEEIKAEAGKPLWQQTWTFTGSGSTIQWIGTREKWYE